MNFKILLKALVIFPALLPAFVYADIEQLGFGTASNNMQDTAIMQTLGNGITGTSTASVIYISFTGGGSSGTL